MNLLLYVYFSQNRIVSSEHWTFLFKIWNYLTLFSIESSFSSEESLFFRLRFSWSIPSFFSFSMFSRIFCHDPCSGNMKLYYLAWIKDIGSWMKKNRAVIYYVNMFDLDIHCGHTTRTRPLRYKSLHIVCMFKYISCSANIPNFRGKIDLLKRGGVIFKENIQPWHPVHPREEGIEGRYNWRGSPYPMIILALQTGTPFE